MELQMRTVWVPSLALMMLIGMASLVGCAAIAKDQQAYDTQKCQSFGLPVGSDAYIQCVSQGANAYAASRSSQPPAGVAPIAVLPINIGIPIGPQPPTQNNACSAPKSSPRGSCAGCSVSCGNQQASCTPGQEIPGGSDICVQNASCTCQ